MPRAAILFAVLMTAGPSANGAEPGGPPAPTGPPAPVVKPPVQAEPAERQPRPWDWLMFGAEYHNISLVSASVAAPLGRRSGAFVEAAPGWYAGRLSLGYGVAGMPGICGVADGPGVPLPLVGWQAKLSLMQTWGSAEHHAHPATYLGPEVGLNLLVHGSLGVFHRISHEDDGEDDWRLSWSVGIGF